MTDRAAAIAALVESAPPLSAAQAAALSALARQDGGSYVSTP